MVHGPRSLGLTLLFVVACNHGCAVVTPTYDAGDAGDAGDAATSGDGCAACLMPDAETLADARAADAAPEAGPGVAPGFVLSAYKDTSIAMNWNTNVIGTAVPGKATPLVADLNAQKTQAITLAFATGECGTETWGNLNGGLLASANVSALAAANLGYTVSTGGAGGAFTCASDAGFAAFLARWSSKTLLGVDFDIEGGQTQAGIDELAKRTLAAHAARPALRFSFTLAVRAGNDGSATAHSLGAAAPEPFNTHGMYAMSSVKSVLGFTGSPATWPAYVTVNLMVMDYGGPTASVCVVSNGVCDMGQSALQAAYNVRDKYGVPMSAIELTPMLGGNDVQSEKFRLEDVDTLAAFALSNPIAGLHFWSFDRDVDCPAGPASATCNSMGNGYAGPHGYLARFASHGLR